MFVVLYKAASAADHQGGTHAMKYVLLFGETKERAKQWESMPEAQRQAAYAPINQWFEKYGSKITGGHELQPERTATTVKFTSSSTTASRW